MLHITDGHEELVRRLQPEDVVPWFESLGTLDDAGGMLFAGWLAQQPEPEAERAMLDLEARLQVLTMLAERAGGLRHAACSHRRAVVGSGLVRELVRQGDMSIRPYDARLVKVDSIDLRLGTRAWKQRPTIAPVRAAEISHQDFCRMHRPMTITDASPLVLAPNAFVDALTLESVTLPPGFAARVENVSSSARLGVLVVLAKHIHAGHQGPIVLEIKNLGEFTLLFEPGDVIAQLVLERVEGADETYGKNAVPYRDNINGRPYSARLQGRRHGG